MATRSTIDDEARAAGLRFAAAVTPADRAWILAAVQRARPEAARLIAEVDGLVEVRTELRDRGDAIGVTRYGLRRASSSTSTSRASTAPPRSSATRSSCTSSGT